MNFNILKMNTYNLKARVYPVILSLIPIIFIGSIYSFHFQSYYQVLTSLGITTAFYFLFSQIGRDKGKALEKEMWKKWGGAPTTQILRFSNDTIDKHTKNAYHNKLKKLTGIGNELNEGFENNSPQKADKIYQSWTKFLLSKTRDTKKYDLLFQENINYGFRRNLLGLKGIAILIIVLLMISNFLYSFIMNEYLVKILSELLISETILILILIFWIGIVKENWIKTVAFSYAERLMETINTIGE